MTRKAFFVTVWALATAVAVALVLTWMLIAGARSTLLVGQTTAAHRQIEMACESCHAAPAFADAKAAEKAMNIACRNCHENELKAGSDSHPRKAFRSPRMAVYWERLDARLCTTCHVEHRPEVTRAGAVTMAMDFCAACHAECEQDVRRNRSSHAGLTFDTCATADCHNYHDNRALYEDYLVEHAHQPWLQSRHVHALSALYRAWKPHPEMAIQMDDAVAPKAARADREILDHWADSGHAAAEVNCAGCPCANGWNRRYGGGD